MKFLKRAKFLLTLIGLLIAITAAGVWFLHGSAASSKEIRNILLISIDTCRADYLSCYGYPRQTTPNIDRLAEEGILFTNVISPVPITLPAHCSMLTGTIPPYHRVHDNSGFKLADSHTTLAEILKPHGFTAAAIVSAFVLDSQFGLSQGFDTYNDRFEQIRHNIFGNERRAAETSRLAVKWLQANKEKKFLLFLHYYDPHDEYEPPEPFASEFADNLYAGEIAYTDHCIAPVIQKLKELRLYDSTLIIVVGDHGEMLGEHNEKTHTYFIYQSAIKVPLIFKFPGQTRHQKIDYLVGLVDILPTICSVLGIEIPAYIHGKDLSPCLEQNGHFPKDRYLYCESLVPTRYNANFLLGLATDRFKYIQTTHPELYDIIDDPHETKNLIHEQPQQARILQDRLKQILEQTVPKTHTENKVRLDEQTLRRLESLGYVAGNISEDFEFDQTRDDPKELVDFHNGFQQVLKLNFEKKYTQAENLCQKLLSQRPRSYKLLTILAAIAMKKNDFAKAVTYLNQALKLNPNEYELRDNLGQAHYNLARVFVRQNKLDEAVNHYEKSLQINPEQPTVHNELAAVYYRQKKFDQAVAHLTELLRLKPNQPNALNDLAIIYSHQGKTSQAFDCWNTALKLKPNWPTVIDNLAWVKATHQDPEFRNPDEAIQLAKRACELTDQKQPQFLNTLAAAYAADARFPDAVQTAQKALDLALSANQQTLAEDIQNRLEFYKRRQPYRDSTQSQ